MDNYYVQASLNFFVVKVKQIYMVTIAKSMLLVKSSF